MNTNLTRKYFLTYFYDKNPKVRTKTKIGMSVTIAPDLCKLQCVQNSAARIVTNTTRIVTITTRIVTITTKYSHITPVRKTIGCMFNISVYLRLPYWCTCSYKVVILTILNLFSNDLDL